MNAAPRSRPLIVPAALRAALPAALRAALPAALRAALGAARRAALGAVLGVAGIAAIGCDQECCTIDSLPIPLRRAPLGGGVTGDGALVAMAKAPSIGGGQPFQMLVDTASPITILSAPAGGGTPSPTPHAFELLDATADATAADPAPVRARFQGIGVFTFPLGPAGDAATLPLGVLGGDLLRGFSIELRFAAPCPGAPAPIAGVPGPRCSSLTFWRHQGATAAFLEDAGYAVLDFSAYGGGETTARTTPDTFGLRAPVTLPPTRVVLRTCAAPEAFVPDVRPPNCCSRGTEVTLATGVDLSLLLATGVGPLVLSQAAWTRVLPKLAAAPAMSSGPLLIATWPTPIPAMWSTIPRVALVDMETLPQNDPGPCVELGRSRRLEWVARQQQAHPDVAACVQPCDTDPREPDKAQNSAAYLELGGSIPVAVVADSEAYLQALRFDVRPEGPEIDGLIGAGALAPARLEVDYRGSATRAIFSCEQQVPRETCFAASRCPRLPDSGHRHLCFGLPAHGLPATCEASGC
jgi:hypothetical protein